MRHMDTNNPNSSAKTNLIEKIKRLSLIRQTTLR